MEKDNNNSISSDLIRGHIDTIILRTLSEGDKHGNEICQEIEDRSGGEYEMKQPTLYSSLKRLEQQGYVKAYWSGVVSGGRRRYFKLTDAGRETADKNLDEWLNSRRIIDELIMCENAGELYPGAPRNPSFDYDGDDGYVQPAPSEEEEESKITLPVIKRVDQTAEDDNGEARENDENLQKLDTIKPTDLEQLSLIAEETADEEEQPTDEVSEDEQTEPPEAIVQPETAVQPEATEAPQPLPDDDLFDVTSGDFTRKYTELLKTLLPPYREAPIIPEIQQETPAAPESSAAPDSEEVKPNDISRLLNAEPTEQQPKQQPEQRAYSRSNSERGVNYSAFYAMAREQGFKVKSADKTNAAENGKLLISKLIAASAIVMFLLMSVEMACILFPFADVLGFSIDKYMYLTLCLLAFPLAAIIVYIVKPKRAVTEIMTFKYSMSVCLIIALNLILLTFAYALIIKLDFSSIKAVLYNVIAPILVFLNIPIYCIIKYLLIENGAFYLK